MQTKKIEKIKITIKKKKYSINLNLNKILNMSKNKL